jgi:hypothetical protein
VSQTKLTAVSLADVPMTFVAIATRPRKSRGGRNLVWTEIEDAPLKIADARNLERLGYITACCRHSDEQVEFLVKRRVEPVENNRRSVRRIG